jgi:integrase
MATVRKREWTTSRGKKQEAWIVDYFDQDGVRRQRTFPKQRHAKDWLVQVQGEIKDGTHTPDTKSITVAEAAGQWLDGCKSRVARGKLVPTTERQYRSHVVRIAKSSIGNVKLSRLTKPMVNNFRDELLNSGVTEATTRKIVTTLKMIISAAQDKGLVVQNVAIGVKCERVNRDKLEEGKISRRPTRCARSSRMPGNCGHCLLRLLLLAYGQANCAG